MEVFINGHYYTDVLGERRFFVIKNIIRMFLCENGKQNQYVVIEEEYAGPNPPQELVELNFFKQHFYC